jgi:hypothetical protein
VIAAHPGHGPHLIAKRIRHGDDRVAEHLQGNLPRGHGSLAACLENPARFHPSIPAQRGDGLWSWSPTTTTPVTLCTLLPAHPLGQENPQPDVQSRHLVDRISPDAGITSPA